MEGHHGDGSSEGARAGTVLPIPGASYKLRGPQRHPQRSDGQYVGVPCMGRVRMEIITQFCAICSSSDDYVHPFNTQIRYVDITDITKAIL